MLATLLHCQVAGPEDYFDPEDPDGYTPCVDRPDGPFTAKEGAPCMFPSCMCQSYMLPEGLYRNPWDQSQKTAVLCGAVSDKSGVMVDFELYMCKSFNHFFSPPEGNCIEKTIEALIGPGRCEVLGR
jgi:hypothetical protein